MRHRITLYDTLGIERDASDSEIRKAFRKLAMEQHPDRFTGDARARAELRFQEITEAFNVLSHPESREKYDKEIHHGSDTKAMDRQEISRRLTAKGSQELRAGNLAEALETLKGAVDHDDQNARAHYFYGLVLAKAPGRGKDALRHMERASTLEDGNATIKAEAAALSLAIGMKSRAIRFAEQALAIDPTNSKAAQTLAEAEGTGKEQKDGLLGRFKRRG